MQAKLSRIIASEEQINLVKDKHPVLILGFLGSGLVGDIVASEVIEQLDMVQIGYIITEDLPPIAVFHEGVLKHAFRLYYCGEKNVIVALCEIPFNQSSTYSDLARLITDWAIKIDMDEICVIQGLGEQGFPEEHPIYVAAEKEVIDRIMEVGGMEVLPKGLIMGPEAAVLNEGLNNQLNCYALLTPVNAQLPNPGAAAEIVDILNKIYNFGLDSTKLREEAEEITKKLMELNQKTEQQHNKMLSMQQGSPGSNMYL